MVPRSLLLSAKVTLLAAIYVTVAHWGLQFDPVNRFATIIWPPAGVSLAALLLFGRDLWPGIAIGAAIVNVWIGAPLPVACGIALGNTLEALLGWYALQKIPGFRLTVDRLRDALGFIVLAAILSTAVSATIGVTSLYLGGLIPASRFAETWFTWWQGDALGDLIVAAFLLNWIPALWVPDRMSPRRIAEALALGAALVGMSAFLFQGDPATATVVTAFRQPTTLLPVLIWAALRFGTRGATGATLVVSGAAIWSTVLGHGPFIRTQLHESLAVLQAFMSVVAVMCLVLSAVTTERHRADREKNELFHRERLARAHADEMQRLRGT